MLRNAVHVPSLGKILTTLQAYAPNDALRRVKSQTPPEGGQLFSRNVLLEQLGGEGDWRLDEARDYV